MWLSARGGGAMEETEDDPDGTAVRSKAGESGFGVDEAVEGERSGG